jgi:phytoene dehydrogenase-like protein
MTNEWDVIVIGGGLAGLAAGAAATAAGASTVVLEAHQPGGRARTVDRDGYTFNMGGHALYVGGPGMAVLRSLGVRAEGAAPPLDRYRALAGGRQHVLPTGAATLARTTVLGRRSKVQFAALLARIPTLRPSRFAGVSVAEWLGSHDLRPDTEAVVRALIRISTYADDLDSLGADAVITQLKLAARSGVIYVHGGWASLIDGLAERTQVRTGVQVTGLTADGRQVEVLTADGTLRARRVVLACGGPAATRGLLATDPGWPELGPPVTAACLDVGVRRVPEPGYVLGLDDPIYGTTQSPPARQAPDGHGVVAVIRYGARSAELDRPQLERHLSEVGVRPDDVVTSRFLASMVVTATAPLAATGGLPGRPAVTATGVPGVLLAGDWVGPEGILADASLASGNEAGRRAAEGAQRPAVMVA